jgi:hypothetical protein
MNKGFNCEPGAERDTLVETVSDVAHRFVESCGLSRQFLQLMTPRALTPPVNRPLEGMSPFLYIKNNLKFD